MTRYFEYAESDGEGTLVSHGVLVILPNYGYSIQIMQSKSGEWLNVVGQITVQRYAEFITIHGSEVAV